MEKKRPVDRNNTSFPAQVKNDLSKIPKSLPSTDEESFLRYYQRVVLKAFMSYNLRGLLLYHTMGYGKSITASAIASALFGEYRILFLASRSIHQNFRGNIKKYLRHAKKMTDQQAEESIDRNFDFVTLNAGNVLKTLDELNEDRMMSLLSHMDTLDHTMVIVDEAHNLFNSIVNGSKNASSIYEKIMNARNVRVLFLTGTPGINDPFELVSCFNMISGERLLPEIYDVFRDTFTFNGAIKNADAFKQRIFGLVSYYGDFYQQENKDGIIKRDGFPDEMPTMLHKIKMSHQQEGLHITTREREKLEAKEASERDGGKAPIVRNMTIPKGASFSTYRVRSRKAGLFVYPEGTYTNEDGKIVRGEVPKKYLTNELHIYSPKYKFLIDYMKMTGDWPIIIFCNFVADEGLNMFANVLKAHDYPEADAKMIGNNDISTLKIGTKKRFALITGNQTPEDRSTIMEAFNNKANVDGQIIGTILLSPAGAEGLSFKNIMDIFQLEPYWNMNRPEQVKFRAIRFDSHSDKPKNKQRVRSHMLLSVYNNNEDHDEPSTDVAIYNMAIAKNKLISQFRAVMVEASIDCTTHHNYLPDSIKKRIDCKLCAPTNKRLYDPKQLISKSNCAPYSEKKVKTKKIKYGDAIYHYDSDKKIYMFSDKLDSWVIMPRHHEDYADISDLIESK